MLNEANNSKINGKGLPLLTIECRRDIIDEY